MTAEVCWKVRHRATDNSNSCFDDTTIEYISVWPCFIYASNRTSTSYLETTYPRPAAGASFQVRSDLFDSRVRKYSPIELATMALDSVSKCNDLGRKIGSVALDTCIKPVRNTAVTPILFLYDICSRSLNRAGSGNMKM